MDLLLNICYYNIDEKLYALFIRLRTLVQIKPCTGLKLAKKRSSLKGCRPESNSNLFSLYK